MSNVIADPSFEQGVVGWSCRRGETIGVVSWERSIVRTGSGACRMTRTHPTDTGTLTLTTDAGYPCQPNETWYASGWVYNASGTARQFHIEIMWRGPDGVNQYISGPLVSVPINTWTQLTVSGQVGANAENVRIFIDPPSGFTQGQAFIVDDVVLTNRVDLSVRDDGASVGYGRFSYPVATNPPAAAGTAVTLTPDAATAPISGVLLTGGTQTFGLSRKAGDGPMVATVSVTGIGTTSLAYTVEKLALETQVAGPADIQATARWAFRDAVDTGDDASIDWGDGSPIAYGNMAPAGYAEGIVDFGTHTYDVTSVGVFDITITSGTNRTATQRVVIVPSGRSTVVAQDGSAAAVCDIQEWPDHEFARDSAVLPVQGRDTPVVLLDALRRPSSTITFLTRSTEEADALLGVLKYRGKVQISAPCPGVETGWFAVLGTSRVRLTNTGDEVGRLWPTTVQEVDAP